MKTLLKPCCIFLFLFLSTNLLAELPKGKLVEKVECQGAAGFSYALYLPSTYQPEKTWPVLFCFDARADGMLPAGLFQEGAEKYGYIIVSSNNSGSDDPSVPNLQAMKAMYDDALSRFSVDKRRLYATGFSGGARTACDMGFKYPEQVAGVIGCGAGFPTDHEPTKDTPFAFYETIGNLDFNYYEMRLLRPKLESAGIPFKIRIFDGDHMWPPKEICTEALEWMEVQAMKNGKREKDPALIETLFKKRLEKAESQKSQGLLIESADEYQSISNDFNSLRDVDSVTSEASRLYASEEVKKRQQEDLQRDQFDAQFRQKLQSVNRSLRDSSKNVPKVETVLGFLDIASLKKKAAEAPSKEDRLQAQRLLEVVAVQHGFYLARGFREYGDYPRAALTLSVAAEIHPEEPLLWYKLAAAQAQLGEKENALASLKKASENGFNDAEKMENDFDLKSIRDEKQFKKILDEIKKKTQPTSSPKSR
jgi:predicted esterase